jgi:hypothetical protein
MTAKNRLPLQFVHNDIIDGNVDQLDEVADESHQNKTHSHGIRDFNKFYTAKKATAGVDKLKVALPKANGNE